MAISWNDFTATVMTHPAWLWTVLLTLGVVLVNGWTDAPNAIATCVATRALSPRRAVAMAVIMNFLGAALMTWWTPRVAVTVYRMVDFGTDVVAAQTALCAALIAIVVWATAAWWFGIPTSESHALIAGLSGAAWALQGNSNAINGAEWSRVLWGLLLSTLLSFVLGWFSVRGVVRWCFGWSRPKARRFFGGAQVVAAGATAFMHGAQDGQKFMGVFLLGLFLQRGQTVTQVALPWWVIALCAGVMALGTAVGGGRIIRTVGMDMVRVEPHGGFAADVAAAGCLLICSLCGIPASTTNAKTTALMGVGAAKRPTAVHWDVVREMVTAWVLTFPGCGLLGFAVAKLGGI